MFVFLTNMQLFTSQDDNWFTGVICVLRVDSAGKYTASNSKLVWIKHTVWIKLKKNGILVQTGIPWLSNVDSVVNWVGIPITCIHFWQMVGELGELLITHNYFFNWA